MRYPYNSAPDLITELIITMSPPLHNAYISCPKGVESLLVDELKSLGEFEISKQRPGGVVCQGNLASLYKACLWSRLANRVLLLIDTTRVENKTALREWLLEVEWTAHLHATQSLHVRFFGELPDISHTQFGAQFVKDAIVDYFRDHSGTRPQVDKQNPDIRFQLNIDAGVASLYLDLSGNSLHQRGYRQGVTAAPLKENLAAALLVRAGWPAIAARGGALIDTACGSGTLLTEAAMIAAMIAPGLLRTHYGFLQWPQHDAVLWAALTEAARAAQNNNIPPIIGYDEDVRALGLAERHIAALGLDKAAPRVYAKSIGDWKKPTHIPLIPGLLIANPPYGERLGHKAGLQHLYHTLGSKWLECCPDWQAALFTADPDLAKATRLYWDKAYTFYNGALECKLYLLDLARGSKDTHQATKNNTNPRYSGIDIEPFVQRLHKNQKRLSRWLQTHNIQCYRLYDADIPEFAVAVDIYGEHVHVQEYKAPASIDPAKAEQRLAAVIHALPQALQCPPQQVYLKQRTRQRGSDQYTRQKQHPERHPGRFVATEGAVKLWVDLSTYLDTGLFLDHRPLRLKLAEICNGKRFLNLFSYTATASVHAAMAGATETISVDMSKSYQQWAQDNFTLNNISGYKHQLIRADVLQWLDQYKGQYDVIFLDPPTFSNSKRMEGVLDTQRDHALLIRKAMQHLAPGGVLYFSTNFRRFKLDAEIQTRYTVHDISAWSIPEDFARNNKIHYCFEIRES